MKVRVSELRGFKSLRALNGFHALCLGLKMLPAYMGESYEEFFNRLSKMEAASQEILLREAALFVELDRAEVEAMIGFCLDPNGVPISSENLKNLAPGDLIDCIVAVCMQIAAMKIDLVSDDEKKKSEGSR